MIKDKKNFLIKIKLIFPDIDRIYLEKRLNKNKFFYIKRRLTEDEKTQLWLLGDKAIVFEKKQFRIYPQKNLFSHVLGQVEDGNIGISIISATDSNATLAFGDGTSGTAAYQGMIAYINDEDVMTFRTLATERMRISGSGEVGIGTNAPDALLHVHKGSAGSIAADAIPLLVIEENDNNASISLKLNQWLENKIKKNPSQWIWTHDRWK